MKPCPSRLGCLLAVALAIAAPARGQIKGVSLVQNLAYPIAVSQAPGDPDRLFLVSQLGTIRILESGALLPAPFLDVSSEVLFSPEQGLLGMTFDPDYASNGWFYVFLSVGSGNGDSVVRRYKVSADPDSADPTSALTIAVLPQFSPGHKGGTVTFGPDGYLWWAPGDSNQHALAQDLSVLYGKLLRLDVHGDDFPADPLRNYAIPPDNPFVGVPGVAEEIWDYGLRNPWRFSFDTLNGDLWIGDVGQFAWEEIDHEPAGSGGGRNYGWPRMEGFSCYDPPTDCDDGSLTPPVHVWPHTACNAAAGGYVYRGAALPGLYGHYFFADYCLPAIWSFRYEGGAVTEFTDWSVALDVDGALKFPDSFWQDEAGELYVVEYRAALGEVWKIVPDPAYVGVSPLPVGEDGPQLGRPTPNPFRGVTRFDVRVHPGAPLDVAIFDTGGRRVRQLHRGETRSGTLALGWDGRDAEGEAVASGAYLVRARSGDRTVVERVIRVR